MTGRTYTPEMAVDLRVPFEPRFSPDGRFLAFRVEPIGHRSRDRTSAIFVMATDGSTAPRALTGSEENNTSPAWSPDGNMLAFLSDRPERGTSQLHVIPAQGGEALRLTELKGGVANVAWSAGGRSLLFTARRRSLAGQPDPDTEVKVAGERWRPHGIARVPAMGGAPELVGPDACHVWCFALSPDGRSMAAMVSENEDLAGLWDNLRLVVSVVDSGPERELLRLTGFPGPVSWSGDGSHVAVVGSRVPDVNATNVLVVNVATGDVTVLDDRGMSPSWAAFRGDELLVHSVEKQRSRLDVTDVRGSEWEPLSFGPDVDSGWIDAGPNVDVHAQALAFAVARPQRPADVYVSIGDTTSRLTDLNPQLDSVALADMQPLEWVATDGTTVHGWLMLPPGSMSSGRLPLVTAIHGGPSWHWGNWFHGSWHDWDRFWPRTATPSSCPTLVAPPDVAARSPARTALTSAAGTSATSCPASMCLSNGAWRTRTGSASAAGRTVAS